MPKEIIKPDTVPTYMISYMYISLGRSGHGCLDKVQPDMGRRNTTLESGHLEAIRETIRETIRIPDAVIVIQGIWRYERDEVPVR